MKIQYKNLAKIREENPEERIVFCDGTFDLLHVAHIEHLQNIRSYGDMLVVGVMSDEWVKSKKGDNRPILDQNERCEMLNAIKYVDYTFVLYDESTLQRIRTSEALKILRPNIFVTTDLLWQEKKNDLEKMGIELRIVAPTPSATHMSTSKIIQRILNQVQD